MNLALLRTGMPRVAALPRTRTCHWGTVEGPRRNGRRKYARVWICEYPYRTIRLDGPDPECDGCRRAGKSKGPAETADPMP